jgi:hypothetical protein
MRVLAAYALIFYGVVMVASIPGMVRRGQMAAGAALSQALTGITMVLAAFGLLLAFVWAVAVAIVAILIASLLAAYHGALMDRGLYPRRHLARTILALVLVLLLVFGN